MAPRTSVPVAAESATQVHSMTVIARQLDRHRETVGPWLKAIRLGGLAAFPDRYDAAKEGPHRARHVPERSSAPSGRFVPVSKIAVGRRFSIFWSVNRPFLSPSPRSIGFGGTLRLTASRANIERFNRGVHEAYTRNGWVDHLSGGGTAGSQRRGAGISKPVSRSSPSSLVALQAAALSTEPVRTGRTVAYSRRAMRLQSRSTVNPYTTRGLDLRKV